MAKENLKMNPDRSPIHSFEKEDFKMAWNRDFREMLRANPGIIKTAIELSDRAVALYDPPENPIKGYRLEIRFDKETGKWLEKTDMYFLMRKENYTMTPITGETASERVGWRNFTGGRGTILVPGEPVIDEKTGLEVILLGRSNRNMPLWTSGYRYDKTDYIKMSLAGQSFFVKRSFITNNPGYKEFQNTVTAKEALKDLDFVRVVDAQLGHQDKKESWYVSKWENLENAGFNTFLNYMWHDDYGEYVEGIVKSDYETPEFKEEVKEMEAIEEKGDIIKQKLAKFNIHADIDPNLFYNPETKMFVLLDVSGVSRNAEGIGNPIREK